MNILEVCLEVCPNRPKSHVRMFADETATLKYLWRCLKIGVNVSAKREPSEGLLDAPLKLYEISRKRRSIETSPIDGKIVIIWIIYEKVFSLIEFYVRLA